MAVKPEALESSTNEEPCMPHIINGCRPALCRPNSAVADVEYSEIEAAEHERPQPKGIERPDMKSFEPGPENPDSSCCTTPCGIGSCHCDPDRICGKLPERARGSGHTVMKGVGYMGIQGDGELFIRAHGVHQDPGLSIVLARQEGWMKMAIER